MSTNNCKLNTTRKSRGSGDTMITPSNKTAWNKSTKRSILLEIASSSANRSSLSSSTISSFKLASRNYRRKGKNFWKKPGVCPKGSTSLNCSSIYFWVQERCQHNLRPAIPSGTNLCRSTANVTTWESFSPNCRSSG